MAGALSESAPRPVSVVTVDGASVQPRSPRQHSTRNLPTSNQQPQDALGVSPPNTNARCARGEARNDDNNQPEIRSVVSAGNFREQSDHQVESRAIQRSFASTEAQTECLAVGSRLLEPTNGQYHHHHHHHHSPGNSQNAGDVNRANASEEQLRDARRRERRVRRHHRRAMRSCSMPPTYQGVVTPGTCISSVAATNPISGHTGFPLVPPGGGFLHPPPPHLGLRGLSLGLPFPVPASVSAFGRDAVPKQCCGLGSPPVRWSILGVGIVGLVCAAAGALLGALRATGRDHIAVSLLMIGIGVVLVTVSAVAWRVTSRENCNSFFGFTGITGRMPPARPMHPYAAMIYPEFQFRTPPPSYQASMQEYRLRLLLLDRLQPTSSPPPTYRSNAPSIITPACTTRESRPPSYCGRVNVTPTATLATSKKDANLVRIVQTESEPVILSGDQTPPIAAVEVLAHL